MKVSSTHLVAAAALAAPIGLWPVAGAMEQPLAAQGRASPGNRIDWRRDLAYLATVLPRVHADPYHAVSPERFDAVVRRLARRISGLPGPVARVELAGLVALVGDGHTRVDLLRPGTGGVPAQPDSGFVPVPIRLYWFADGIHVRSAAAEHRDLVGARLLKVGRFSTREAADRVRPFMHRDNEMTLRLGIPWLLVRPAFVRAAGVTDGLASIPMEFETRDGERLRRELRPLAEADPDGVGAFRREGRPPPIRLRDNDRSYWFDAFEDGRTVYVQFNAVVNDEDETLEAFAHRLRDHLDANDVERLIVDLRHNDGGDFALALPLVDVLDGFDATVGRGSLFVLTGRATFSAAGVFAALVDRRTEAVFVGEPTGARPNTYGDLDTFTLPSSGLVVAYSKRYFQPAGPYDERPWIDPEITSEPTFEDYAAGRDPVLAAVEAYRPEEPLGDQLVAVARDGTVEDALALYRDFMARPERRYYWAADDLGRLGFHYWREGAWEAALPVWRRSALDYPDSAEGHENLAETYQAMGDRESAVEALLASLRVDPRNPDAIELVDELCGARGVRTLLRIEPDTGPGRTRLRRACGLGR